MFYDLTCRESLLVRSSIFRLIAEDKDTEYIVTVSYIEIYNEAIADLLVIPPSPEEEKAKADEEDEASKSKRKRKKKKSRAKDGLKIYVDPHLGPYVQGLKEEMCRSKADLMAMIRRGDTHRSVSMTQMNRQSSRSHAIFKIKVGSCPKRSNDGQKMDSSAQLSTLKTSALYVHGRYVVFGDTS